MSELTTDKNINPHAADGNETQNAPEKPKKRRRPVWVKILLALGWTAVGIVVLVLALITVAVTYLQPERLTPIVEKYANEYLNADVSIGRTEISFWHTFPKFELDVRQLSVRSKALDSIPAGLREKLPAGADSLLYIEHFNGAINIPELFAARIALYDINFEKPRINIVQATPELSNLDIFPKSDEEEEKNEISGPVPNISIGTFAITGGMPIRYVSLPDSTDINITLLTTELSGKNAPDYSMDVHSTTSASFPSFSIRNLGIGIGGKIIWDHKKPYHIAVDDFGLQLGEVKTALTADVDFEKELSVNALAFSLPETPAKEIIALIPEEMKGELAKIKADFDIALDMRLSKPFLPASDSIPSFTLRLNIPEGSMAYDRLRLNRMTVDLAADVDGTDLDKSTVDLKKLVAIGDGVGFELNGHFSNLLTDPTADGTFKGGIEIDRLPKKLLEKFPGTIDGSLRADSRFSLRRSYLDKYNFHRVRLSGDATLKNFRASMPELPAELYTRVMELKFGTTSSFTRGETSVDSLLTASLRIDTISASVTGMDLQAAGLKMGVGCQNTSSSADTTIINPIGGRIVAERILFKSQEDSMRVRLRKPTIGATLRRFKGDSKKPQLHLDIAADGAFYGDRVNRAILRKALLFVTAHPASFRPRNNWLVDSLTRLHPELTQDSIRTLARAIRRARLNSIAQADSIAVAEGEAIDISVDNSMRRLLHRWEARGVLKAERMGVFTPYFPLRNVLSNLDARFTSDSLIISDTRLRSGHSSLVMNGNVSNITKALTSLTSQEPLRMDFSLTGDTIDVNEIASAAFAGAAFAERDSAGVFIAKDTENEHEIQASVQAQADTMATLIVPSNIEANMEIKAGKIMYSDITFSDFNGRLNVYKGAINLERMSAHTAIGSVNLNALYSAPSKEEASFVFGMKVNDFHIGQFLNLVPALDTVMPLLSDIDGIINADIAASTDIDDGMNINIPSLKAAVKLSGDSLVLIDKETFRKIGKWLLFKHKDRNVIDHMNVELIVNNSQLELFPFIFDMDRYKFGVMGTNDMAMNLHYHIAVLKSPIPFKFGINISGNVDNMKIRLGGAKFNEKKMPRTIAIADTTRINLVREIGNIFRRGVRGSKITSLDFSNLTDAQAADANVNADTISHADSLYFMKEGLIPMPDTVPAAATPTQPVKKKKK